MTYVPSTSDWTWLGGCRTEDLARYASSPRHREKRWFQEAYRWIYDRLPESARAGLSVPRSDQAAGPPRTWVPVLGKSDSGGILGFVSIETAPSVGLPSSFSEKANQEENRRHAYNAGDFVVRLFRGLDDRLGVPVVTTHLPSGGGSSLSLPVFMAALGKILNLCWPDTLVATGCFENEQFNERLMPVPAETLPAKVDAAQRFGYRTLILVAGQQGAEHINMETRFVSSDPLSALFDLLSMAEGFGQNAEPVAKLLAAYSQKRVEIAPFDEVKSTIEPFLSSPLPLVRHVANDLCSRSALHNGFTDLSQKHREEEGALRWQEYPTGWLGHYLRYEQVASWAIIAVDSGLWEDDEEVHRQADSRLRHLEEAKNKRFADANDFLAILALKNTRALRRRFLARFRHNSALLNSAWSDLWSLHDDWDSLFDYCRKIDRLDSTWERQRNYAMATLTDAKRMNLSLDQLPGAEAFLRRFAERERLDGNSYDLTAWLERRFIINEKPPESELAELIERADALCQSYYPNVLPYEALLRFGFGTEAQKEYALQRLEHLMGLSTPSDSGGILSVLKLRTRALLTQNGRTSPKEPNHPAKNTLFPHLADLAVQLLAAPETLIDRVPY